MSDTPRTDNARGYYGYDDACPAYDMQKLERELAASQAGQAELLARLEERTQSHLHASARDVQTIQQQAVELAKIRQERVELWQEIAAAKHGDSGFAVLQERHDKELAKWQALAEGLVRALAEIGKFTFCDGPNCPFCEWDEHPPSKEAIIAATALAAYEAAKSANHD